MVTPKGFVKVAIIVGSCLGCDRAPDNFSHKGNVSFTVASNGAIYLTTPEGKLVKTEGSNETTLVLDPNHGKFSYVDSSRDGKMLAVVLTSIEPEVQPITLLLSLQEDGSVRELARTEGAVPCFSRGSKSLYLCRPARYVEQVGFGGRFWTDYKVFLWDWETDSVTQFSDASFNQVDDSAYDDAKGTVLLSASFIRADGTVFEKIVEVDKEGVSDPIERDCQGAHVCSGDPGLSTTGSQLLYISDTRQPFYYDLVSLDRQLGTEVRLLGSESHRFFKFPEFDSDGAGVYALAASKFTFDGQPVLDLIYFSNGKAKLLLTSSNIEPEDEL